LNSDKRLNNTSLLSWSNLIAEFDFRVEYIRGKDNVFPDLLSRSYSGVTEERKVYKITEIEKEKVELAEIVETEGYEIVNYSSEEKNKLLQQIHSQGHFGSNSMADSIHKLHKIHWKGLSNDITNFLNTCNKCLEFNISKEGFFPRRVKEFLYPFDSIAIDIAHPGIQTNSGFNNILVLVDAASRFVILEPLRGETSEEILEVLFKVFNNYGSQICKKGWRNKFEQQHD
jgi:hypothetical protein